MAFLEIESLLDSLQNRKTFIISTKPMLRTTQISLHYNDIYIQIYYTTHPGKNLNAPKILVHDTHLAL